jgi:hypothetical protein
MPFNLKSSHFNTIYYVIVNRVYKTECHEGIFKSAKIDETLFLSVIRFIVVVVVVVAAVVWEVLVIYF